jgi:pimeloyl-ACP methyl ester carboxylesterase
VTDASLSTRQRVVLIHGAATTSRIWDRVVALLDGFDVRCPDRRCSGDLDTEVADLLPLCANAIVVGVSGGATLGLELAARGCGAASMIVHEPAVGSLLPGLLNAVAAAYADGGVPAFATTLYGPNWQSTDGPLDDAAVARDIAMFRAFEPSAPIADGGRVLVTVGENSPQIRHDAAAALAKRFGLAVRTLPAAGHAIHLDRPGTLASLIRETAAALDV